MACTPHFDSTGLGGWWADDYGKRICTWTYDADSRETEHVNGLEVRRESLREVFLVAQSHDDDCRRTCSERGSADLMFSHQKPTGYGGFRNEPSKEPRQCNPRASGGTDPRGRFRNLPAIGG